MIHKILTETNPREASKLEDKYKIRICRKCRFLLKNDDKQEYCEIEGDVPRTLPFIYKCPCSDFRFKNNAMDFIFKD